ncbi:VOC family protein [Luteimicrobium sp. NPDC057192]|uniref:VOC family protein n=1 Tax=Luteimicrobium sp. NPDC057192 TaxID=3346042 RepID=UPI003635736F
MPARGPVPAGAPIWNDLTTDDLDATVAFYAGLFGWTHEGHGEEYGNYGTFSLDGKPVAGVMPPMSPEQPLVWSVHLHAPDIAAAVDAARSAGGTVLMDALDVMGLGKQAVVVDPAGAAFSLWQPGTHQGFEVVAEHGAPGWHELHTQGFDEVLPFYDALGWTTQLMSDEPQFRYAVDEVDDHQFAGIMDDPRSGIPGPSYWLTYFGTDDADATAARITELGGTVVRGPEDTPYGRLVNARDPRGSEFSAIGPNIGETPQG